MTLREQKIAAGHIIRWTLTPAELAARGFYAAADAANRIPRRLRATVDLNRI